MTNQNHTQRAIHAPWDQEVIEVDAGISDFMELLWRSGCKTLNSCQANPGPGTVWVQFFNSEDAERFLNVTCPKGSELHERVTSMNASVCDWEWKAHPIDLSLKLDPDAQSFHMLSISLRFPESDLPEIMTQLGSALPYNYSTP